MSSIAPRQRAKWHDAYDAQMGLWRWYRTDAGRRFMGRHCHDAGQGLDQSTREMMLSQYGGEMGRLIDCDPIYASGDMCDLVAYAADPDLAEPFKPEPLLETDLITTRGFLLYEKPFQVRDRFDEPTDIRAISWIRMLAHDNPKEVERLRMEMFTKDADGLPVVGPETDIRAYEGEVIAAGAYPSGIALTVYSTTPDWMRQYAPIPAIPMHLTPWFFNMSYDGNEFDEIGVPTGALWWWRIVQTTFRLMQQRISVRHVQRPDRDSRREAKKLGMPDETQVVVVRLRREESERKEPSGEEAHYSHRFIVHGFWRNQWYPSEQIHRQIFIDDFVKGPKDKPLIVKPRRVFQWNR